MTERALPLFKAEPELTTALPDDLRLWSVTTIIGALSKSALEYWAAIKTAEAAVDDDTWQVLLNKHGREAAIKWLKESRYRTAPGQRTATKLGTAVHKAIEHKVLNGVYSDADRRDLELRPFLHGANGWLKDFEPKFKAAEVTIYSPTYGYAGTADAFVEVDGLNFIVDFKTTKEAYDSQGKLKGPYPEVALQLAAYRYAEMAAVWRARQNEVSRRRYYLLNETERALSVPVPKVDHGAVLHLSPEGYQFCPVKCDEEVFDLFLALIDVARFQFEMSADVIGPPMIPPSALRDSTESPFQGLPS